MGIEFNKIGNVFNVLKGGKINPKREVGDVNKAVKKDEVKISKEALDYQIVSKAVKTIKELPEVREDVVAALKEKIDTGSYNIEGKEVAEKLLSKRFDKRL